MIAGQMPAPKNFPNLPVKSVGRRAPAPSPSTPNVIQSNLSERRRRRCPAADGRRGSAPRITNNQIVNNISTHEGGGIAIDDATDVTVAGNTVMKNITTATAMTSDGTPAPAGLSTADNSTWLTAPPAADTCLAPLSGGVTAFSNGNRRLTVNSTTAALTPYVNRNGLTVTITKPGSQTQTRNVASVNAGAQQINITNQGLAFNPGASTSGWTFTINVPASLSTFPNCVPVQASFTPPTVFDNVFWDNRAGTYDGGFVRGIGLPGDSTPSTTGTSTPTASRRATSSARSTTTSRNILPPRRAQRLPGERERQRRPAGAVGLRHHRPAGHVPG